MKRCPDLRELDLSDCTLLTSQTIDIVCNLRHLEYLSLSRCYNINVAAYLYVLLECHTMESMPIHIVFIYFLFFFAEKSTNCCQSPIWTYSVCCPIKRWPCYGTISPMWASINSFIRLWLDRRSAVGAHQFGAFVRETNNRYHHDHHNNTQPLDFMYIIRIVCRCGCFRYWSKIKKQTTTKIYQTNTHHYIILFSSILWYN